MTNDHCGLTLIGEEIASAWNEAALKDIAHSFGGTYAGYDGAVPAEEVLDAPDFLARYDHLIAAENVAEAESAYAFRPPGIGTTALIVGNEAKGLRRRTRKLAQFTVQIPLPSRKINCLNVAAAAAVMLHYFALKSPLPYKRRSLTSITNSRPGILLLAGSDHMELGSTLRSVCAFGWDRVLLDDRENAWYECDRRIKSEGRGTARRGRNPIKILPHQTASLREFRRAIVFTAQGGGRRGCELPLTGRDTLIVLQDESAQAPPWRPPGDWHGDIHYACLPPVPTDRFHYRQMSAIALAEAARQLGEPAAGGIYLHGKKDRYRREMKPQETAPLLDLADLLIF